MRISYEIATSLQYENRNLRHRLELFESGEKYIRMQQEHEREVRKLNAIITGLEKELAEANIRIRQNTDHWMQVNEDVVREKNKIVRQKDAEILRLQNELYRMMLQRDKIQNKQKETQKELYAVKGELQDEQNKARPEGVGHWGAG